MLGNRSQWMCMYPCEFLLVNGNGLRIVIIRPRYFYFMFDVQFGFKHQKMGLPDSVVNDNVPIPIDDIECFMINSKTTACIYTVMRTIEVTEQFLVGST